MDTIANILTTLLNAQRVGKKRVAVPYSVHSKDLLEFLNQRGYVAGVRVQESPRAKLVVTLAYQDEEPALHGAKRLSRPGQRYYAKWRDIPFTYEGIGTIIVSTPAGLKTDKQARREKVGGELMCAIW